MPPVPWPSGATGFALQMISSACHTLLLLGCTASKCSGQAFCSDRAGSYIQQGASQAVTQLPCLGGGDQAPELAKLVEALDQADPHFTEFPGQTVPLPGSADEQGGCNGWG